MAWFRTTAEEIAPPLQPSTTVDFVLAGVGATVIGIVVALSIGAWPGIDKRLHASGAQVAYRFNSYIALALSERMLGTQGRSGALY